MAGILAALLIAVPSFGQCGKDIDCKGNRICVKGECVEPAAADSAPAASAPQPSASPAAVTAKTKGSGVTFGIIGLALSTTSTGFGIAAAATSEEGVALPSTLGGISLLILGVDVPLTSMGGATSRDNSNNGIFPLRLISWITYGATLGCGIGMIVSGVAGGEVPQGLIIATVINGAISGYGMSIDAIVSGVRSAGRVADDGNALHFSLGTTRHGGVSCLLTKAF
jgi:hypothetical protein